MGTQVSHRIYPEVSEKDRLLGDARGYPGDYPGFVQMERSSASGEESDARPYPSAFVDSTEIFRIQFYGIFEGEKRDDDIRASRKFE